MEFERINNDTPNLFLGLIGNVQRATKEFNAPHHAVENVTEAGHVFAGDNWIPGRKATG
jgi:hypothetical protein